MCVSPLVYPQTSGVEGKATKERQSLSVENEYASVAFSGINDNTLSRERINVNDMREVVAAAFPTTENVHPNLDLSRYLTDKSRAAFLRNEASAMILAK